MQELFRESNTLTVKIDDSKLKNYALDMKLLIEEMREQTQNVEWFKKRRVNCFCSTFRCRKVIFKEIISNNENIELSVSATTRSPREGETHGKDYFFITDNEFNDLKKKDAFIESADVHGHQYGTLKAFVEEKLENNISVVLDIDVQGFIQISNSIK